MSKLLNFLSKIKEKIPFKKKNIFIFICIGILCIVLLALPSFTSTTKAEQTQEQSYTFDSLEYANQVSANLQNLINNVKGVSNAKVVVVVEQSPTTSYLTETTTEETAVVYIKQGSSYQPVKVTEFLPKITGILIVAKGTQDLSIKNNLLNAISAVYNIDISSIDILEGK